MKQTLLFFTCFLWGANAFSQEINSNWFLEAPDSVSISSVNLNSVDTSLTGNQVTWSFQGLSQINPLTLVNGQSADVPSGALFTEANYVPYIIDNPISRYNFYTVTPTQINQIGTRTEESGFPTVGVFSDNKTFATFPLNFGDTEIDSFSVSLDALNGQLLYSQSGEHKLIVDGNGTLITPSGTFNDVLRIRAESRYAYEGLPPIPGSDNTGIERTFMWISPALPGIILLSSQFVLEAGFTNGYAYYSNVSNLSTPSHTLHSDVIIFPNPAEDFVNIDLLNASDDCTVTMYSQDGKRVFCDQIGSTVSQRIDLSGLNPGLYILQIQDNDGIVSNKHVLVKK
jgi:hypothetical protein